MCHDAVSTLFPVPHVRGVVLGPVSALRFGTPSKDLGPVVVLPDIYGANAFYRGFSEYLAQRGGVEVLLVDPFAEFGELPEQTREAAFARRDRLDDAQFMDSLSLFLTQRGVSGVVGFCIGGLFAFELARREFAGGLVAFYPFPQGLVNSNPVPTPWTYLHEVRTPVSILVGRGDHLLGETNIWRLGETARANPAIDLHLYRGVGHGFLQHLDSEDQELRQPARTSLDVCAKVLFG